MVKIPIQRAFLNSVVLSSVIASGSLRDHKGLRDHKRGWPIDTVREKKHCPPSIMLQEYNQAIISAAWVIILSFIPQDLVRVGTILLGCLICLHTIRPRILIKTLQLRLSSLDENLQDAIDSGIMRQSDISFTNKLTEDIVT